MEICIQDIIWTANKNLTNDDIVNAEWASCSCYLVVKSDRICLKISSSSIFCVFEVMFKIGKKLPILQLCIHQQEARLIRNVLWFQQLFSFIWHLIKIKLEVWKLIKSNTSGTEWVDWSSIQERHFIIFFISNQVTVFRLFCFCQLCGDSLLMDIHIGVSNFAGFLIKEFGASFIKSYNGHVVLWVNRIASIHELLNFIFNLRESCFFPY